MQGRRVLFLEGVVNVHLHSIQYVFEKYRYCLFLYKLDIKLLAILWETEQYSGVISTLRINNVSYHINIRLLLFNTYLVSII